MTLVRLLSPPFAPSPFSPHARPRPSRSAWYDTSYHSRPIRKVVIIASNSTTSDSRVFEDMFVQKLTATGVAAMPGYSTVPQRRAVRRPVRRRSAATGADDMIIVRLLRVDTRRR